MPIPLIAYGLAALGLSLLASGCSHSQSQPKVPEDEEDNSCKGSEYNIRFGDETAYTLCHEGDNGDGNFQAGSERLKFRDDRGGGGYIGEDSYQFMALRKKLHLPFFDGMNLGHFQRASQFLTSRNLTSWNDSDMKCFNRLLEFCERHQVDLGRTIQLAEKVKTKSDVNTPLPDMSSTVKLNVILLVASLLSLEAKQDKPAFKTYQPFIQETLEQIDNGKLSLVDLSGRAKDTPAENMRSISYFPELNQYLLAGKIRDDNLEFESSVMVHELYHFYQDYRDIPLSFAESEQEALLLQANMLLDSGGLLKKEATNTDLENFVNQQVIPSGLATHPNDPIFHALILQFIKNQEGEGSLIQPGPNFKGAMLEQFFDTQVTMPVLSYLGDSQKNPAVERFFGQYHFNKNTTQQEVKEKLSEYLGFLKGSREKKFQDFSQNFSANPGKTESWNTQQQKRATLLLGGIFQDTTDIMVLTILREAYDPKARQDEAELLKRGQKIKKETLDRLIQLDVLNKLLVYYDGIE